MRGVREVSRETEREREVERYKVKLKESWHSVGKRERRLHMTRVLFVYYAIEQSANLTTTATTMSTVVQQTVTRRRRRNVNSSKSCRHQCK